MFIGKLSDRALRQAAADDKAQALSEKRLDTRDNRNNRFRLLYAVLP
jgi:hypothetical protein